MMRYWLHKKREKIEMFIVWKLLPSRIVYWAGIRLWANATTGRWKDTVAPDVTLEQLFRRWEQRSKGAAP